ncbi:uncharacterized protein FA14DRAFT_192504 [Meira miltonrushii]|uniref:Uncharacterized protein n=1 Tax=Meira miltonrushii TaxID=1280837 RepID=A0A316V6Z6_9BASI|nr:uncharacterized protein FA14DRAFT_192504 [Meira miltonrushii]PWN32271.1 hypothetical protein FA14DRAFT_192504 [Meira miltonrushii]
MPAFGASVSDIYATSLYAACEGLPLWNPCLCDLGDVGFVRQGTFHKIYNAAQGPQSVPSNPASNVEAAWRTQTQYPEEATSPTRISQSGGGNYIPLNRESLSNALASASYNSDGERSDTVTEAPSPAAVPTGLPGVSGARLPSNSPPPGSRRSSLTKYFPRHSSPGFGSNGATDGGPPLPLHLEAEPVRAFDMGPRMSSNYHNVGVSIGANVHAAGVPLGATLTFESSGGDGSLLVARDPVERHLLLHVGVLKAYLKAHRRYIHETYGQSEDVEMDDLVLVYGKDCSSDWAVAVTLASSAGNRVEFEVFTAAKAGLWGGWKTTCTASQRGPHRPTENSDGAVDHSMDVDMPSQTAGPLSPTPPAQPIGNISTTMNLAGDGSFSLQANTPAPAAPQNGNAPAVDTNFKPSMPNLRWNGRHGSTDVNQSIILRRITARSRLGLNVFPPSLRASAGPRNDGPRGPPPGEDSDMSTDNVLMASDADELQPTETTDPLNMVHEYILNHPTAARANVSIASDHDASLLCRRVLQERWPHISRSNRTNATFKRCIWEMADQLTMIIIDRDNVATLYFPHEKCMQDSALISRSPPASVRPPMFRTPSSPASPSEGRTRRRISRVNNLTPVRA